MVFSGAQYVTAVKGFETFYTSGHIELRKTHIYTVQCREIVVLATYNPVSGTRLEGLSILYIIKGSVKGDKVNSSKCVFSQLFIQYIQ